MSTLSLTIGLVPPVKKPPQPGAAPVSPREGAKPEAVSSLDLVRRAQAGDQQALNDLCERYLPRLQRWAHGRLYPSARGAVDTYDLVQNTLTKVVRRLSSFEPRDETSFQGYVRTALKNQINDANRAGRRRGVAEPLDTVHPSSDASPLEVVIGERTLHDYEEAMKRLRPEDRDAIVLRVELGLPYHEVAEALGKPSVAAAHMAVSRALVRLAKEMARGKKP